jgi:L-lactate dehydrogenase complex protein LldF
MKPTASQFKKSARVALADPDLQRAMGFIRSGFVKNRRAAVERLPEFDELRESARGIKEHTLQNLDFYLEAFEKRVKADGGKVHWASTPDQARDIVLGICRRVGAKRVTKGKSMVGEEIAINEALEGAGFEAIETDLGEYIIQLAEEPPSHIIAPAVHKTKSQITELFHQHHARYGYTERQTEVPELVDEARKVLREKFLSANVGITGANFLVAETGSTVIVTNEGNGDLTNTLPPVHIVTAGIEKVVPTREDVSTLLRVLARSATGQEMAVYTTFSTGPRRKGDLDGPSEFHVVLLDNGRSQMLGNEFHEMLRCIRCGACLNHCPVYQSIGGHAYGWVYVGPMGSVLTPLMIGLDQAGDLPNACTLNGRCQEVCPMGIGLPDMLRQLRRRQYQNRQSSAVSRAALAAWSFLARRPRLYRRVMGAAVASLAWLARGRGRFRHMLLAGGWTSVRDLPAEARGSAAGQRCQNSARASQPAAGQSQAGYRRRPHRPFHRKAGVGIRQSHTGRQRRQGGGGGCPAPGELRSGGRSGGSAGPGAGRDPLVEPPQRGASRRRRRRSPERHRRLRGRRRDRQPGAPVKPGKSDDVELSARRSCDRSARVTDRAAHRGCVGAHAS